MRRSYSCLPRSHLPPSRLFGASTLVVAALLSTAERGHAAPAQAADPGATGAPATSPTPASASVVNNLIRLLVQEGVLSQDKASALIRQAEDEAAAAARGQTGQASAAGGGNKGAAASTSVRVPYIPEIVRKQIRDEVKDEVIREARAENWAAPNQIPEWTQRIKLSGDFRLRGEFDFFDHRNLCCQPNFAALNAGNPFDLANQANVPLPLINNTADRTRMRERFRLGLDATLSDDFSIGLRLATGNTTNPVSTNTTLGTTLENQSFNLDRAYIRYRPESWLTVWAGRFPNPWFSTDLVWDDDLNFDGVAVSAAPRFDDWGLTPFVTAGAFPIENTPFNLQTSNIDSGRSRDKWLFGAQTGVTWQPDNDYAIKVGVAYYHYTNVEGKESDACIATTPQMLCDTDNSRPGFIQQGNTLFGIRNLVSNGTQNPPFLQYYGLASRFHELDLNARFDYAALDPIHIVVDADFTTNLAFDRALIAAKGPVNNNATGAFQGGPNAFMAKLTVGRPQIREAWEWNAFAGYRYVETDAVLDAFTDSDFHLGGTNAKGYFVGGSLGVGHNVDLTARWLSAREVTGLPYSVDVIQLDLNGRF